ncbi:MAG: PilN domain-containing protein [Thiohalophilus sp.]
MSLKLSFVPCEYRAVPVVFALVWTLLLLLLVVTVGLLVARFELAGQTDKLAGRQAQLQEKLEQHRQAQGNAPSLAQFQSLQQRIIDINELAGRQGAGLSAMLSRMEQLLPDQAYVTSLVYRPADNELLLTVEAPSAEQLTGLLQAAEASRRFSEVLLTRQSQENRRGQRLIQFEIRLRAAGS